MKLVIDGEEREVMVEEIRNSFLNQPIVSVLREPTEDEVRLLGSNQDNCDHKLIYDEPGWLYDFRYCAKCGIPLGIV